MMIEKQQKKFLTVAPFECAWQKELKFKEAGRGCVAFEASARNDVTVVFREHVGSQHYHYKTDSSPHYTIILGSHRNRRLKIEVNGKTVVDVEGVGLCSSEAFQSYWISIYDGFICVGKGRYPFQNVVFQWLDSNPNCNVQYVGLSSWDKHVGYRNVNVFPLTQNHISLWKQLDSRAYNEEENDECIEEDPMADHEKWGLENFLESWELSDVIFIVGMEEKPVPAHKLILAAASGKFQFGHDDNIIHLPDVCYLTLHALLQYIYTGKIQIPESQLGPLRDLSLQFGVMPLVMQCEDAIKHIKEDEISFDSGKDIAICYPNCQSLHSSVFPSGLPTSLDKLKQFYSAGDLSDMDIYIEGYGLVARSHKIVISSWSVPFLKMFTNGMSESGSTKIFLRDVYPEAFKAMLEYMYSGELNMEDIMDNETLLLHLLLLADQFGISLLQQECCKIFLECLSEDSVSQILQVISSMPSCKVIEESCKRKFSMQFDYCTTASMDFILLDEATFRSILQHPDLTVTSEERVLNAILLWSMQAQELYGWDAVDNLLRHSTPELLFGDRLESLNLLLPLVRFPLMPLDLLKKLEKSCLMMSIPVLAHLVEEAVDYAESRDSWAKIEPKGRRFSITLTKEEFIWWAREFMMLWRNGAVDSSFKTCRGRDYTLLLGLCVNGAGKYCLLERQSWHGKPQSIQVPEGEGGRGWALLFDWIQGVGPNHKTLTPQCKRCGSFDVWLPSCNGAGYHGNKEPNNGGEAKSGNRFTWSRDNGNFTQGLNLGIKEIIVGGVPHWLSNNSLQDVRHAPKASINKSDNSPQVDPPHRKGAINNIVMGDGGSNLPGNLQRMGTGQIPSIKNVVQRHKRGHQNKGRAYVKSGPGPQLKLPVTTDSGGGVSLSPGINSSKEHGPGPKERRGIRPSILNKSNGEGPTIVEAARPQMTLGRLRSNPNMENGPRFSFKGTRQISPRGPKLMWRIKPKQSPSREDAPVSASLASSSSHFAAKDQVALHTSSHRSSGDGRQSTAVLGSGSTTVLPVSGSFPVSCSSGGFPGFSSGGFPGFPRRSDSARHRQLLGTLGFASTVSGGPLVSQLDVSSPTPVGVMVQVSPTLNGITNQVTPGLGVIGNSVGSPKSSAGSPDKGICATRKGCGILGETPVGGAQPLPHQALNDLVITGFWTSTMNKFGALTDNLDDPSDCDERQFLGPDFCEEDSLQEVVEDCEEFDGLLLDFLRQEEDGDGEANSTQQEEFNIFRPVEHRDPTSSPRPFCPQAAITGDTTLFTQNSNLCSPSSTCQIAPLYPNDLCDTDVSLSGTRLGDKLAVEHHSEPYTETGPDDQSCQREEILGESDTITDLPRNERDGRDQQVLLDRLRLYLESPPSRVCRSRGECPLFDRGPSTVTAVYSRSKIMALCRELRKLEFSVNYGVKGDRRSRGGSGLL